MAKSGTSFSESTKFPRSGGDWNADDTPKPLLPLEVAIRAALSPQLDQYGLRYSLDLNCRYRTNATDPECSLRTNLTGHDGEPVVAQVSTVPGIPGRERAVIVTARFLSYTGELLHPAHEDPCQFHKEETEQN